MAEQPTLTPEVLAEARRIFASSGGKGRAKKLSAKRRSEIASMGAKALKAKREGKEGKAA